MSRVLPRRIQKQNRLIRSQEWLQLCGYFPQNLNHHSLIVPSRSSSNKYRCWPQHRGQTFSIAFSHRAFVAEQELRKHLLYFAHITNYSNICEVGSPQTLVCFLADRSGYTGLQANSTTTANWLSTDAGLIQIYTKNDFLLASSTFYTIPPLPHCSSLR